MVHRRPGARADRDVVASASADGSNSGASTTHTNDQAASSIRPQPPADLEPGGAEQRPGRLASAPAAKNTQSPGVGADRGGQPGPLGLGEVLGDRAAELAVLADQDVGQALGAALLGPVLPGVERPARLRRRRPASRRRRRTAAWNTRNGVSAKYSVQLDQLQAEAQVGLVGAVAGHRLGVGHPRDRRRELVPDQPPQRGERRPRRARSRRPGRRSSSRCRAG